MTEIPGPGRCGIEVEGLGHRYPQSASGPAVLDDIHITSRAGQFIALIGPSGCGKTTLLDVMCGLHKPQSGKVLIGGRPPQEGRADTARMFARDALLPWRTAAGNIEFALKARQRPGDHLSIINGLLRDVGLAGFASSYPSQLSQGMRQRVALARTFALESPFLFLDEPFGALDAQTKLVLQEKLLALWERTRSTVVLVTHDLAEAIALADRVIVMTARPGRVLADVTIDLPRPRSVSALQTTRSYHDLYSHLWDSLEEATGRSDVVNGTAS